MISIGRDQSANINIKRIKEVVSDEIITIHGNNKFETYSPLTSDILKCASYADKVSKADSLGLIEKYFSFIVKWWWLIIAFMIFAIFTNGGITCDIVIGVVLIASYIWGNYYSECSKIAIQFSFLGASSYSWDSFEAADNTLKEAKYLIPKLEECEKQTEETKRWEMYLELVKEMDDKYGERKHMLGRPYSKQQAEKEKEKKEREEIIKEARVCACNDVIAFLENINVLFQQFKIAVETDDTIKSYSTWFNLELYLRARHSDSRMYFYNKHRFNYLEHPSLEMDRLFDETYQNIYDEIVGEPISGYHRNDRWGLCELIYLYSKKIYTKEKSIKNYYSLADKTCLEGEKLFEIRQAINDISEIKDVYDKINILPEISDAEYTDFSKSVKEHNYTFDDIREELR